LNNVENILDWLKKSQAKQQTAWMGLFGDDLLGKDPLVLKKDGIVSNKMDKLKLEYEAFGTFISEHPLDWLYSYLKRKYNFSTQILDENYEGDYKLFGFVKDIVKSTKFWGYFVEIEDITGTVRIFFKNIAWLNKFDILALEWRKQKRIWVSKILKINLEKLVDKLKQKNKFKPEETVAYIRKLRGGKTTEKQQTSDLCDMEEENNTCILSQQSSSKLTDENSSNIDDTSREVGNIEKASKNFKTQYYEVLIELPENIEALQKLAEMKKQNPSQKEFELDGKIYLI